MPGHDNIETPIVEKKTAQILSISGNKAVVLKTQAKTRLNLVFSPITKHRPLNLRPVPCTILDGCCSPSSGFPSFAPCCGSFLRCKLMCLPICMSCLPSLAGNLSLSIGIHCCKSLSSCGRFCCHNLGGYYFYTQKPTSLLQFSKNKRSICRTPGIS